MAVFNDYWTDELVVVGLDGDAMGSNLIDELYAASLSGDIRLIDTLAVEKVLEEKIRTTNIYDSVQAGADAFLAEHSDEQEVS
jgi:hypothetical protein